MKHTPGPWTYTPGIGFKHYVASENGDLELSLQEMHWRDGREVPAEANARLIAAAPDLLEACEMIMARLKGQRLDAGIGMEALGKIQAAIAKAEGRTP